LSGTSDEIPYNEKNLVYKAAKLFFDEIEDSKYTVSIFIEKNIPVAAGLAGGSTDAAGTLFGLNKLLNSPLNKDALHELCSKLGSDLNFCLKGGRQLTTGRGEILTPQEFEKSVISLIKPLNLGISAKEAYTKFSEKIANNHSGRENYINDLEWAVIDDYEQLQAIKLKYPDSVMSGSGSTYYIKDAAFENQEGYWVKNNLQTVPEGVSEV
jgi:4-diphosphocytidyl-2-C-methyl-D-erythritol kinase